MRDSLIRQDLIAFDGSRFQVLALPPAPISRACPLLTTPQHFEERDPITIHQLIRSSLRGR